MMKNAALYLRSSKDRNDVSIQAQRRELEALAVARNLTIVRVFEDAVESGSTDDRPGYITLTAAVNEPRRGWDQLLLYDTSRLARRRYIAQAFKHTAKKRGVTLHYARLPADMDPIAEVILESSFEAMDEVLSILSRDKGLMGMRENVARGWRAGGRAPLGYVIERHSTGAVREGKAVQKSKLALGPDAGKVSQFLEGRSAGLSRAKLMRDLGIDRSATTMVCVEWNALTYAGHTVWNVHAEPGKGVKRRPRAEWVVHRDTHPALITEAQAEVIISQLTNSNIGKAVSRAKSSMSGYLLTGLLLTRDGRQWTGKEQKYYKLRRSEAGPGKLVLAETVDQAVLAQLTHDMRSDDFLQQLLDAGRKAGISSDPAKPLRERIIQLEREKARAAALALTTDDGGTFQRLVEDRSRQVAALRSELEAVSQDVALSEAVRQLTPARLKELLFEMGGPRAALTAMVERVVLDPELESFSIHYKPAVGLSMASPRGFGRWDHAYSGSPDAVVVRGPLRKAG